MSSDYMYIIPIFALALIISVGVGLFSASKNKKKKEQALATIPLAVHIILATGITVHLVDDLLPEQSYMEKGKNVIVVPAGEHVLQISNTATEAAGLTGRSTRTTTTKKLNVRSTFTYGTTYLLKFDKKTSTFAITTK